MSFICSFKKISRFCSFAPPALRECLVADRVTKGGATSRAGGTTGSSFGSQNTGLINSKLTRSGSCDTRGRDRRGSTNERSRRSRYGDCEVVATLLTRTKHAVNQALRHHVGESSVIAVAGC